VESDTIRDVTVEISNDDARRLFLRAQGLLGAPDRCAGVPGVLQRLGSVQLDTISVLARSHELVAYARLGPVGRAAVEAAYWSEPATAFEYWAHAACILPMADWPWFAFRRRRFATRYADAPAALQREVVARLTADGPLTATELGGARKGGDWWDWSDAKQAVERLLATGVVVCTRRQAWRRVYDLADRAVPAHLRAVDATDDECLRRLVEGAGRRLAVATEPDLADYYRLELDQVRSAVTRTSLVPVAVRGWTGRVWADPEALDALATLRGRHRTTLLSPFDPVIWDRRRTERMFGFTHRLEAYVPRAARVHGYFTMPLLAVGRLVGRVDPARDGQTLVVRGASIEPGATRALADALADAASWVGATSVQVERLTPDTMSAALSGLLAERVPAQSG
jgi:hypothetical protein